MILTAAIVLFVISFAFFAYSKISKKENTALYTLRIMPALSAVMGLVCVVIEVGVLLLGQNIPKSVGTFLVLPVFFCVPFVILAAGFFWYVKRARDKGMSTTRGVLSFIVGFILSSSVTVFAFVAQYFIILNIWQSVELPVSPSCELQMRQRPAFCPEFDRRIAFKSGKKIGIYMDTCGLGNFNIYTLKDGSIYLKQLANFGNSYIVDAKTEKVYDFHGETMFPLTGGLVSGRWGSADDKEITYDTYGGKEKNYKSRKTPTGDILKEKKFIGQLKYTKFYKGEETDISSNTKTTPAQKHQPKNSSFKTSTPAE